MKKTCHWSPARLACAPLWQINRLFPIITVYLVQSEVSWELAHNFTAWDCFGKLLGPSFFPLDLSAANRYSVASTCWHVNGYFSTYFFSMQRKYCSWVFKWILSRHLVSKLSCPQSEVLTAVNYNSCLISQVFQVQWKWHKSNNCKILDVMWELASNVCLRLVDKSCRRSIFPIRFEHSHIDGLLLRPLVNVWV